MGDIVEGRRKFIQDNDLILTLWSVIPSVNVNIVNSDNINATHESRNHIDIEKQQTEIRNQNTMKSQ